MRKIESIFRKEDGAFLIEIRLTELKQFFNTFDPSPFHDKDIDDDAERYIVNSVRAFSLKTKLKLVFYLPQEHYEEASKVLAYSIDNYFDFRATMFQREMRSTLYEGRVALLLGLLFLFTCIGLRTLLGFWAGNPLGSIALEGLSIVGWVAMWRPIQIFLYDWWSLYRTIKIYEKIRDMALEISLE
ncbi:MAG: hypothetical protein PHC61_14750 [Chitinivibrionales bacterium]|nr:hypothetical protein [Chitinivibrionales bacterium]